MGVWGRERTKNTEEADFVENQAEAQEHENAHNVQEDGDVDARDEPKLAGALGLGGQGIVAVDLGVGRGGHRGSEAGGAAASGIMRE